MGATQPWYVEKRAESLAIVLLTRRDDLRVERNAFDYGPDLLVSILKDGAFTGRQFGVELKAKIESARPTRVDARSLRREREHYRDAPFPVCVFLFMMEDDAGYYRWIREPVVDGDSARLEAGARLAYEPLGDEALAGIVDEINGWYNARA